MSNLFLILALKRRIAWNYLSNLKRHMAIHLGAFLIVILALIGGGYHFFHFIFEYLMSLEVIGEPLMNYLTGMVLTTILAMLIFSNLITMLSTAYISREVDFYMALPVTRQTVFFLRLIESTIYSSWAFSVLSFPLVVAFGAARDVSWTFYLVTLVLTAFFLLIPAGLGALITMLLSAMFPARKTFRMVILLGALGVAVAVAMGKMVNISTALSPDVQRFNQLLSVLRVGSAPVLPSAWLMRGMLAASQNQWMGFWQGQGVLFWLAVLGSSGLFVVQACTWLAPRIYYRGWRLAGETSASRRGVAGKKPFLSGIDPLLERLRLPAQLRAIISKDIKTFWRDPSQWSQLMILFGLLFIYVANLRSASQVSFAEDSPFWVVLMSFFNLGAGCFVLSILTTRFVYPMLSLEGRQFWTIGLAPIRREVLVWEKYWLCWAASFGMTGALMVFSNLILGTSPRFMLLSIGTVALLSFGLTSLSVGLGAMTPNFREDNPARIANGLGGTANIILSLLYIGLMLALEFWPVFLYSTGRLANFDQPRLLLVVTIGSIALLNILVIIVPMRLGLKNWRELEF